MSSGRPRSFPEIGHKRGLGAALRGDTERGLFFRGSEPLPFGAAIRSVGELFEHLLARAATAIAA